MAVYVDCGAVRFRRMVMCHMIADTLAELHEMAEAIGMRRAWFQADASFPHYDVAKGRRVRAIELGAIVLDRRSFVMKIRALRGSDEYTETANVSYQTGRL